LDDEFRPFAYRKLEVQSLRCTGRLEPVYIGHLALTLTVRFVHLSIGNSKANHLGAQGAFNQYTLDMYILLQRTKRIYIYIYIYISISTSISISIYN